VTGTLTSHISDHLSNGHPHDPAPIRVGWFAARISHYARTMPRVVRAGAPCPRARLAWNREPVAAGAGSVTRRVLPSEARV
jgi:hypothetical protein